MLGASHRNLTSEFVGDRSRMTADDTAAFEAAAKAYKCRQVLSN